MQVIECVKEYQMVGGVGVKKGSILTEDPSKESFDGTVFISENETEYHFNNSEIMFSEEFKKSFKLLKKSDMETITKQIAEEYHSSQFIEKSVKRFYRTLANGLVQLIDEGIIGEGTPAGEVLLICKRRGGLE